jgi:hypothetical protein
MRKGERLFIGALVLMLSGCAATGRSTAPPSVDVSGKWVGTWVFRNPSMGSGDVLVDLKQSGAKTTGHLTVTGDTTADPTYFEGIVSGSTIILNVPYLSGTLDVRGDEMKGVVNGIMPANVSLRRQR